MVLYDLICLAHMFQPLTIPCSHAARYAWARVNEWHWLSARRVLFFQYMTISIQPYVHICCIQIYVHYIPSLCTFQSNAVTMREWFSLDCRGVKCDKVNPRAVQEFKGKRVVPSHRRRASSGNKRLVLLITKLGLASTLPLVGGTCVSSLLWGAFLSVILNLSHCARMNTRLLHNFTFSQP